jgi:light-regulated signal transduction histidine kinase (bacteriophytochrome)
LYALRKDGTRLPVEVGLGPVRIGAKTIVLASIVDITGRKRAEDELRRSNEALERSNIELQRFAYVASHDLQTPLRSIAGFAQLLQSEYAGRLDPQADDWIRRTVESSKDMQTLVRDLLEYSRVDSQAGTFGPVSMHQIVEGAVALLDATIRETGATVTHGKLPVVTGDRSQLSQLILNLIGNAIKYRSDAPPRVRIAAERREGEWLFSVCDNGIGIEAKHRDRIFEMFRRLHDQKEIPGSGIGLAVCRRVVHRHGGRIWVESEPGQGSTFFFTIPERIGQAS